MKIILHLDFDSYFVSAERTVNPQLIGKPIAISHGGDRAAVVSISYELKKLGMHAPMPLYQIKQKVRDVIVVKPNFGLYTLLSTRVFEHLFNNYTKNIQVASIDECFLDVSDMVKNFEEARELALKIQKDLTKTFNLPASLGISNNKFVAKMSTAINKPYGVTILPKEKFLEVCGDWNIKAFYGIGYATEPKLNAIGIYKIKDLAKANVDDVRAKIGSVALDLIWKANGNGEEELQLDQNEIKGIGNEITFRDGDKFERKDILEILDTLVEMVAQRMKNRNLLGKIISVFIKDSTSKNHKRNSMQKSLSRPIGTYAEIKREAFALFDQLWVEQSLKFIGLRITELYDKNDYSYQGSIFDKEQKTSVSMGVLDKVNSLMGKKVVMTGTELLNKNKKQRHQSRFIESDRIVKRFDVREENDDK